MRPATKAALLTGFVVGQLCAYGAVSLTTGASASVAPVSVSAMPVRDTGSAVASAPADVRENTTPSIQELIDALDLPIKTTERGTMPGSVPAVPRAKPALAMAGLL